MNDESYVHFNIDFEVGILTFCFAKFEKDIYDTFLCIYTRHFLRTRYNHGWQISCNKL